MFETFLYITTSSRSFIMSASSVDGASVGTLSAENTASVLHNKMRTENNRIDISNDVLQRSLLESLASATTTLTHATVHEIFF